MKEGECICTNTPWDTPSFCPPVKNTLNLQGRLDTLL